MDNLIVVVKERLETVLRFVELFGVKNTLIYKNVGINWLNCNTVAEKTKEVFRVIFKAVCILCYMKIK